MKRILLTFLTISVAGSFAAADSRDDRSMPERTAEAGADTTHAAVHGAKETGHAAVHGAKRAKDGALDVKDKALDVKDKALDVKDRALDAVFGR